MATVDRPRRRIVSGAAWAIPAVLAAGAAPALAASCLAQTLDWDAYGAGATPANPLTVGTGDPTTVTRSLTYTTGTTPGTNSGMVMAGPEGGINQNYFRLGINNISSKNQASLTFSFSQPVYGLTFTLTDIDYVTTGNGWADRVWLDQAGFTQSFPSGSNLSGNGTNTSPWRPVNSGDTQPSQNAGNVSVAYPLASGISSVTITLEMGVRASGGPNDYIGITDLAWCVR